MKKTFCLITSIILAAVMLAGCTAEQQELWDAYLKTGEISSYGADMTINFSADLGEELSSDPMAQAMLKDATADVAMKYLKKSEKEVLIEANANFKAGGIGFDFGLWYDINLTDAENPKALIIYKFPEMISNIPGIEYYYLDGAEIFQGLSKEQTEELLTLMSSDGTKLLEEITSDFDFSQIDVTKEDEKYTAKISNEIIGKYFEVVFSTFAKSFAEAGGQLNELSQEQLKSTVDMLTNANFFGEDGIKADFTINEDGFIKDMETVLNINLNSELTGAPSDIKFAFDIKTTYYDYNLIDDITLPELTEENSANLMNMAGMVGDGKEDEILVTVNGELVEFDVAPIKVNDRTMVPMRKIFEALGAQVEYEDETRLITATAGEKVIKHTIGDFVVYINGEALEMDVSSFETEGRTLVPVRFISNALGAEVNWHEEFQLVEITTQ